MSNVLILVHTEVTAGHLLLSPQETDQPLVNSNPNFIAVPTRNMNLVPTDIRGLTFSRTPQQVRMVVCGAAAANSN